MSGERAPRRRRRPEEAERAILAAARSFLEERPFREMTVERVMVRTGLSRPAFYAYFRDRYDLVTRLLEGIGGLLFAVDWRWLSGDASGGPEATSEVLIDAVRRGSETFVQYGPVLRAIADAADQDPRVEEVYRYGLIERFAGAVAARVSRDVAAGLSPAYLDPEETARALVFMTERYLLDVFGRPADSPSSERTEAVFDALEKVWVRTLYGSVLISKAAVNANQLQDLKIKGETYRVIGAAGIENNVEALGLAALNVSGLRKNNSRALILDLSAVNETSGFEQHGILGGDYLSHFLVKIDLRRYQLKLTPQTKAITLAADATPEK